MSFVFVFLHYLVTDTDGCLAGIWHLPCPVPQPPPSRRHLHDFPSHLFLPLEPFLVYRPSAIHPPTPWSLYDSCTYGFRMRVCVCACSRVCDCMQVYARLGVRRALLCTPGPGRPETGAGPWVLRCVCADAVGRCPQARPLPPAGVDKAAGRRRLCVSL